MWQLSPLSFSKWLQNLMKLMCLSSELIAPREKWWESQKTIWRTVSPWTFLMKPPCMRSTIITWTNYSGATAYTEQKPEIRTCHWWLMSYVCCPTKQVYETDFTQHLYWQLHWCFHIWHNHIPHKSDHFSQHQSHLDAPFCESIVFM